MKKVSFIIVCLFTISLSNAQIIENLSIGLESNSQWYVDDKKTGSFFDSDNSDGDEHIRSNNYLKIDYGFLKNFTASIQVESYEPLPLLNYSTNLNETNIGTYSLNYKSDKLDITAGYFYEQFGNGLILRNWEDRQLGINNALRGGRINYSPINSLSFTGLYGKQRVGFDVSEGDIFGFDSEIDLSQILKYESTQLAVGFSYVGRKQEMDFEDQNFNDLTNAFSSRIDFSQGNFYSSLEFVNKSNDAIVQFSQVSNDFTKKGNALFANFGFSKKGLGINTSFRRLENMNFFSDREKTGNKYLENIINYVPALTKQHDYLLTNIYVYQALPAVSFPDPEVTQAGEIGGQIDVFYTFKKGTKLGGKYGTKIAFNTSYFANLSGDYDYDNSDYDVDFLSFGEKYFSDANLEIRKKWSSKWQTIFYYVNQYYNQRYITGGRDKVRSNILVAEATRKLNKGKSIRLEAQHLWTKQDMKNWAGGTLEINLNRKFSLYASDIYNYGNDDEDDRVHYYNFGGSYSKGATRVALNYGRQRGGLVCVGGVCRFVPENTGLSLNLTTSF